MQSLSLTLSNSNKKHSCHKLRTILSKLRRNEMLQRLKVQGQGGRSLALSDCGNPLQPWPFYSCISISSQAVWAKRKTLCFEGAQKKSFPSTRRSTMTQTRAPLSILTINCYYWVFKEHSPPCEPSKWIWSRKQLIDLEQGGVISTLLICSKQEFQFWT